jgi:hypothetical protein
MRSKKSPENVGKTVRADKLIFNGDAAPGGKIFNNTISPSWLVTGEIPNSFGGYGFACYEEQHLMRIDGHKETEQQKQREAVE